ncbi:MAG: PAS domain-containing protein [Phycisphaerae bacterium]|nr:PAS domain-containing protein [Phycisphaerae bacterium]
MARGREFNEECLEDCLIVRALSGLCVGLILTNSGGKIIWLNRAAEMVLGLPGTECLGQSLDRLLKDLQLVAFWQEAAQTEGNLLGDLVVQWPRKLALKVNATRYVDDDGNEVGRALLFCDVTAERSVQVELSQAVAKRLLALTAGHMPPEPVANLTHQEVRILRLVGRGMGNDEIAGAANISRSTVRSHLKNVYRKLGLGSRAEAVSYAVRNQLA